MPFWSDETWRSLSDASAPVEPFDRNCLEEAKYAMAVGEEVFISSSNPGNTTRQLAEGDSFSIGPGQFAYILTQERVRIPFNAVGFISINASKKFSGLVNISGFHVDPGYHGRIVFSVFNAGPNNIHLKRGERIFPLWIATLDKPTKNQLPKPGYDKIPSSLITAISGNYTTAFEVSGLVRTLREDFEKTKLEVASLNGFKMQVIVLVALFSLLGGGLLTVGVKTLFNWIGDGRPFFPTMPPLQSQPVTPPSAAGFVAQPPNQHP